MDIKPIPNAIGLPNVIVFDLSHPELGHIKAVFKKVGAASHNELSDIWGRIKSAVVSQYINEDQIKGIDVERLARDFIPCVLYDHINNITIDSGGHQQIGDYTGAYLSNSHYYVYALIDPSNTSKGPFYIGKGTYNRALAHQEIGVREDDVISSALSDTDESTKNEEIHRILNEEPDAKLARVIARQLPEDVAFTLESFLIKFSYSRGSLKNKQAGHDSIRFREYGNWAYIDGFDHPTSISGDFVSHGTDKYYVYVLIDPESNIPFYVGKGKDNRIREHFRLGDSNGEHEKTERIKSLLSAGWNQRDVGRIVAKDLSEEEAFSIEALCIRFIYGLHRLTNKQPGQNSGLYRGQGDWDVRTGFDLIRVIEFGAARTDLRDRFLSSGLDILLERFNDLLPELVFSDPEVMGAGEFVTSAPLEGIKYKNQRIGVSLRIQVRTNGSMGVDLDPNLKPHTAAERRIWRSLFIDINKYPLHRLDDRFWPKEWINNTTPSIDEAIERARRLIDFISNPTGSPDRGFMTEGLPNLKFIMFLLDSIGRDCSESSAKALVKGILTDRESEIFTPAEKITIDQIKRCNDMIVIPGWKKAEKRGAIITRALEQIRRFME